MQKNVEVILVAVMDCIEECFDSLTLAEGKRILEVCFVCYILLLFSVACKIFQIPSFITWHEALPACIVLTVMCIQDITSLRVIQYVKKVITNKAVTTVGKE